MRSGTFQQRHRAPGLRQGGHHSAFRIVSMRSQAQSLMPERLEAGLTQQDLANLIEYIETAEGAPRPQANY